MISYADLKAAKSLNDRIRMKASVEKVETYLRSQIKEAYDLMQKGQFTDECLTVRVSFKLEKRDDVLAQVVANMKQHGYTIQITNPYSYETTDDKLFKIRFP